MLRIHLSADGTVEAAGTIENYNTEVTAEMLAILPDDILFLRFTKRWKYIDGSFVEITA